MTRIMVFLVYLLCVIFTAIPSMVSACSSLLVTKGASEDGSVMITYTCDGRFLPHLEYTPAADYEPGDSLEITDWKGNLHGVIPQVPHTYAVVDLMNEHQLAIGETTFDGRLELQNPEGLFNYWDLMSLALQRADTARNAIKIITDLVAMYGYRSTGESISIADTEDAWILEIIGPGEGGKGAQWVAVRLPEGTVSAHANKARIGEFPLDDPENCIYSDNVISFAIERGYYDPQTGLPFRFCDAYDPATPKNKRFCSARVWSFFRRIAPSQSFSPDYNRGVEGAEPYPLWIRPDKKLSLRDVMNLMRDHYEDTPFDMTQGIDAGPYACPKRWRPLSWTANEQEYGWERSISTQQTGFSFISQSRSWLPDPIGGIYWYGLDDTYMTCYIPLYCGIDQVPHSFTIGDYNSFSWDCPWWVFNFVSNFACLKFSYMIQDIQAVQKELEDGFLARQPVVEKAAIELGNSNTGLLIRYLTDYSLIHAESVVSRWRRLGEDLITKYNDGYVKDENGRAAEKGYPDSWLQRVLNDRPGHFRLKPRKTDIPESKLTD